jgi:F420-0:gamma-glutamyl ligase
MGEGAEQTPIAIIENPGNIKFETKTYKKDSLLIGIDEDIYSPFLKSVKWKTLRRDSGQEGEK